MQHTSINRVRLRVDGKEMSLTDFIEQYVVIEPQVTLEDLITVLKMKPGSHESIVLGMITITRIN